MWPAGLPQFAEPVKGTQGELPRGCSCFNYAEDEVLFSEAPVGYYEELAAQVELAARDDCDAIVPEGYDHNCYGETEGEDPYVTLIIPGGKGECVGDCVYTGDCGDPNPYECEEILGEGGGDEAGGGGDADGLNAGSYVDCLKNECAIDRGFARQIYDNPSLLLTESTRLVYDAEASRFEFDGVDPSSLAGVLGVHDGDLLESIDGAVVDDLESGLEILASKGQSSSIHLRILRGQRWVDITLTFV